MTLTPEDRKADTIQRVVAQLRSRLPADQVSSVEDFVRTYYGMLDPEDLVGRDPLNLYGAALFMWNFLRVREPGTAKVHVYNPKFEPHGWESTHTVAEIVTDDMRFLLESVRMALNRRGLTVHLTIHPVLTLCRDRKGRLTAYPAKGAGALQESVMHLEVDRQPDHILDALEGELGRVLDDVRAAVSDWHPMRAKAAEIVSELERHPPPSDPEELEEAKAFLRWIADDHFTFLGYREFALVEEDGEDALIAVAGSELGISRRGGKSPRSQIFAALPVEMRKRFHDFPLLILTKANYPATVHRPVYMDYLGVKRFDDRGRLVGEHRFLGLYTASAYHSDPWTVPLVRRKVGAVMARAGLSPSGYDGRHLLHILETYPRDDLFQIAEQELYDNAMGILHLGERQRIRLFVRRETYGRFYSCIVYVPRDHYDTDARRRMERVLMQALSGNSSEFTVQLSESVLARVYFTIHSTLGTVPQYDIKDLEARLLKATRRWHDDLHDLVLGHFGEERGNALLARYQDAFPVGYREDFPAHAALHDLERLERLEAIGELEMSLYRPADAPEGLLRFKVFAGGQPVPLSVALPMIENMGVRVMEERPYAIRPQGRLPAWLHDFGLAYEDAGQLETEDLRGVFQDAFARVWRGDAENDGFNRLVLRAGLTWREIVVLRACCKYLRQAGTTFSQPYMEQVLADNPRVARLLVTLFHARFDPREQKRPAARRARLVARLQESLDAVASPDEDRILRGFLALIQAGLRTNYYQPTPDGEPKPYLAFKLDPSLVPDLPPPRPRFEIFVYSPRVEGVHLRGGRVARGGIRWSDRREDYRTEVLALMKAQMVKNAVIVPTGAKGGFVVKQPPGSDRDALDAEVVACYRTFIRGLLDLTDNVVGAKSRPPKGVVRYDGDDPYLVVAADKGTAAFSDIANDLAREYRFWLRDAFASGGATGYDHKRMGITARGAWEAVKRHFREIGRDIEGGDFTVAGIGDMSGDVFGNGMLLSRRIKLVAAFDHRHIFLDPSPNPGTGYEERRRLFKLPRSTWADYDAALISPGGGVFPRGAKLIRLSPEVRRALDNAVEALTPNELIRAILRAPVDLLWNGGIGTFVKSRSQSHSEAGDRADDPVRVNGEELRCRVVAEGGNLGFTQAGRIEYAAAGGRINTDFIDNVGGVHCSDYEVNIKILLDQVVANGDMTVKQRNQLLAQMKDEVTGLVLRESYWQTGAISVVESEAAARLEEHGRFIRALDRAGVLNRALDGLPSDEDLSERQAAGRGLTRPEIALLLAHAKDSIQQALVDSDLPEGAYLGEDLKRYFPTPLRQRFAREMNRHPLRREIITAYLTNCMVDHLGPTFAFRVQEDHGATIRDTVRAYTVAREVFGLGELWQEIAALDNVVPARRQLDMMRRTTALAERAALWLLHHGRGLADIAEAIARYSPGVARLTAARGGSLYPADAERLRQEVRPLVESGVPEPLATRVACLEYLFSALNVIEVAHERGLPAEDVAAVYTGVGALLNLSWLSDQLSGAPAINRWQGRGRSALEDQLYLQRRALTAAVLRHAGSFGSPRDAVAAWAETHRHAVERVLQVISEIKAAGTTELPMFAVAIGELRNLVQVGARSAPQQLQDMPHTESADQASEGAIPTARQDPEVAEERLDQGQRGAPEQDTGISSR